MKQMRDGWMEFHLFLEGEVRRGAASVLAGQQPVGVPRARGLRVGDQVWAGRTAGGSCQAVILQGVKVSHVG